MKKIGRIVSILVLTVLLGGWVCPLSARADIIYEPWDSFYEEHRGECVYVSRNYIAAGPNGDVTVYESPESAWKEEVIPNGEQLYISYTYTDADGIIWGCCEQWKTDLLGWVPMDYLTVIYDDISFEEDYGHKFVETEGTLDEGYRGQTIYLWEYPGSENCGTFELNADGDLPRYTTIYTDENGNSWGRCPYYYGWKGYWINLDAASADYESLFPEGAPETEPVTEPTEVSDEVVDEIVPKASNTVKIVTVSVAAVVAVTVVLLYLLKKKK